MNKQSHMDADVDVTTTKPWPPPPDISQEALAALESYKKRDPSKVVVRFKAVGNAPIMKQNFYKITASNRFKQNSVGKRAIHWCDSFTYINLAFSPAPDDTSFCTDGHLIVNYSTTAAWG
ncbi:APG12-domain-containing protein [Mycena amicta]|nr:APG12-domain-containing protein [Mycena amicta]